MPTEMDECETSGYRSARVQSLWVNHFRLAFACRRGIPQFCKDLSVEIHPDRDVHEVARRLLLPLGKGMENTLKERMVFSALILQKSDRARGPHARNRIRSAAATAARLAA